MTTGKSDPRYAATLDALTAARTAAGGVQSALASVQPKLAGAAGISAAAAKQVGDLSVGLGQLYAGSTDLQGGIARLRKGNADLADGISKLSTGGGQLTTGLGALNDGAAALETGLGQLTNGAGELRSGLASGQGPTGKLVGGLGQLQAGVAKFRGALPSTKDLEQLQRESPGLFDSGYFVLAAIQGAPPADRSLASFAVNFGRGGNAGQIVVVPRLAARTKTTRVLGEDLKDSAARFAKASGTEVAVGGPAGDRRSYLVALLTLASDEAPRLAEEVGIPADLPSMAADERVRDLLQREVDAVNARFARIEQVKRFDILERDLSQAEGELTPTLKVKRAVIHTRYADRIDRLYAP